MGETISEDEYEMLEEAAKRQFKRYGNKFVRKFRCYGGPKSGRMVTKAADCGVKKDPFKVRQGKRRAPSLFLSSVSCYIPPSTSTKRQTSYD